MPAVCICRNAPSRAAEQAQYRCLVVRPGRLRQQVEVPFNQPRDRRASGSCVAFGAANHRFVHAERQLWHIRMLSRHSYVSSRVSTAMAGDLPSAEGAPTPIRPVRPVDKSWGGSRGEGRSTSDREAGSVSRRTGSELAVIPPRDNGTLHKSRLLMTVENASRNAPAAMETDAGPSTPAPAVLHVVKGNDAHLRPRSDRGGGDEACGNDDPPDFMNREHTPRKMRRAVVRQPCASTEPGCGLVGGLP
jgi:hypothetical protein